MDNIKLILLVLFFAYNLFVFSVFGIDKALSKTKKRRISEKTLILTSLFGGLGAFSAMLIFRHKTRKPKFVIMVPTIAVTEVVLFVLIRNGIIH